MRHAFAHEETGRGLQRPCHPILCGLNLLGLAITMLLLANYKPNLVVATLPIIIVGVYVVSCTYHWLPYNNFWHKADHQMIVVLTGGTFVSYWYTLLPASEMLWRLPLLVGLTIAVCVFRWFCFKRHAIGGALYLALAAFPLTTSFNELQVWLPPLGLAAFWLGILCYFINFVIHASQKPDPIPEFFGYRETQHIFVLAGTTLQAWVAVKYL